MARLSFLWHLHQPSYRTADRVSHAQRHVVDAHARVGHCGLFGGRRFVWGLEGAVY